MATETYKADGFDDAIVGIDMTTMPFRIMYDRLKMVEILMKEGETEEDAVEFLAYNTWYDHGDGYPRYVELMDKDMVFEELDHFYDALGGTGDID
tara:strand:- start:264 stop:548 length:285 start_codon:yes stop_codon:yes gene_type:complete